MHGLSPADRLRAHFGQADLPHVTRLDEITDRTNRVFDWNLRIKPGRTVDVDIVHAEPGQAVGKEVFDRRGAGVEADEHPCRQAQAAELDR